MNLNLKCPKCGSRALRMSVSYNLKETLLGVLGVDPFRCLDCNHRFMARGLGRWAFLYAKCPRCLRMDLSTWQARYYNPSMSTRLKIALGARRLRCDACRCNFASWLPRKKELIRPSSPLELSQQA